MGYDPECFDKMRHIKDGHLLLEHNRDAAKNDIMFLYTYIGEAHSIVPCIPTFIFDSSRMVFTEDYLDTSNITYMKIFPQAPKGPPKKYPYLLRFRSGGATGDICYMFGGMIGKAFIKTSAKRMSYVFSMEQICGRLMLASVIRSNMDGPSISVSIYNCNNISEVNL
jgi:hypothetical protein